mmetsp:Transcript_68504/g.120016  ORF Transcript_68504/g.120016 Transcript_68504/m.120016 type:complete len:242 (-) Transcript_68504:76-801(-)
MGGTSNKFVTLVPALQIASRNRERCLVACVGLEIALRPSASQAPLYQQALDAGSVEALIAAMTAQRGAAEVQMVACQALQHLAAAATEGGASRVAAAGGCRAVVIAMGAHAGDVLLLQAAAQALELIAFGGSVSRERAVEEGAVEALLSMLKAQRHVQPVQQAALAALQTLVEKHPDCHQVERVAAAGGIATIISTLGDNKTHKQIQYWGRMLLQILCNENRDLKSEAVRKLHYQGIEMDL